MEIDLDKIGKKSFEEIIEISSEIKNNIKEDKTLIFYNIQSVSSRVLDVILYPLLKEDINIFLRKGFSSVEEDILNKLNKEYKLKDFSVEDISLDKEFIKSKIMIDTKAREIFENALSQNVFSLENTKVLKVYLKEIGVEEKEFLEYVNLIYFDSRDYESIQDIALEKTFINFKMICYSFFMIKKMSALIPDKHHFSIHIRYTLMLAVRIMLALKIKNKIDILYMIYFHDISLVYAFYKNKVIHDMIYLKKGFELDCYKEMNEFHSKLSERIYLEIFNESDFSKIIKNHHNLNEMEKVSNKEAYILLTIVNLCYPLNEDFNSDILKSFLSETVYKNSDIKKAEKLIYDSFSFFRFLDLKLGLDSKNKRGI